ncbi:hypothetical protein PRIPAC_94378 [Pristionchus pacificus]|uniref:Major sperm protein n=1 Tax=Pristionchus pacificus TaxID=54126 RepID=A0A2A6BA45_PRIPA|nr:hypothetical protein PRIPAC_94378 [Pristionchus pacificus]|eukprot:PDM62755.1 MSP domain-containing protein [Pristionchus pacificus]
MAAPHPPAGGAKAKDESQRSALRPPTAEEKKTWARSPMPEAKPEGDKALPNCISCFPDVITYQPENKKQVRNLEIKNKGSKPVMFKMKSTSPGLFRMRPIHFILQPAESKIIKLSFKGCSDGKAPNLKDRFTIVMAYPPGVESNVKIMWTQKAYAEKLADCTHRKYVKVLFDGYDVPDKSKAPEPEPEPAPAPPPPPAPVAAPAPPPAAPSPSPQQPGGFPFPGAPGGGGIVYVIYQGDQNKAPGGGGGGKKEEKEDDEKDEKNQLTLLALLACAFTAYSLTPCEDFCQGTILGLTPYCWCNENFLKFNRTCFRKCIANCKAKPSYVGCIPSDGIPNAQLWICCIKKVDWQKNFKCDSECWSTALPV